MKNVKNRPSDPLISGWAVFGIILIGIITGLLIAIPIESYTRVPCGM